MRYGDREPRDVAVDRAGVMAAAQTVGAALEERGAEAARMSAADFLRELPIDPAAREAILSRCELSAANTSDLVSAAALAHLAAVADDACPSVAGGNQRVALALAAELGPAVRLQAPVDRVVWGGDGVTVTAAGGEVDADVCVVAAPASALSRIAFDPPLPERVAAAVAGVVYGHAAKLFVPLARPAPPSAVLSVPGRYWTWTANGDGGRVQPVVSAFVGLGTRTGSTARDRGPGDVDRLGRAPPSRSWLSSRRARCSLPGTTTRGSPPPTRPWAGGLDRRQCSSSPSGRSTSPASTPPGSGPRSWRARSAAACGRPSRCCARPPDVAPAARQLLRTRAGDR